MCLGSVYSVWGQEAQTNRLVDYVSPAYFSPDPATATTAGTNGVEIVAANAFIWEDVLKPATTSPGDRWAKFEQEYGDERKSASAFGRMIQTAKYGLDTACFTAQEAAKELEFTHDFGEDSVSDLGTGAAQPDYSVPMVGRLGHAQLKSEVTVHDPQTGEAFIGLKLAIPFGPGLGQSSEVPRSPLRRSEHSS
jgi:hypothetical protein